jgi:hypothetical protein
MAISQATSRGTAAGAATGRVAKGFEADPQAKQPLSGPGEPSVTMDVAEDVAEDNEPCEGEPEKPCDLSLENLWSRL